MSFPVFKLPFLAMECVLHQIDDCDLIDISLCSKRCAKIIGSLSHMPTKMVIFISFGLKHIFLYRKDEEYFCCSTWEFEFVDMKKEQASNRKFNGVDMFCAKRPSKWRNQRQICWSSVQVGYREREDSNDVEMGAIASYLLGLFKKCKLHTVDIDFHNLQNNFKFENCFSFISKFPIENLKLKRDSENSSAQTLYILKNCQILNTLVTETKSMDPESLLYLNTADIKMWFPNFNPFDFLDFVKKWKFSKNMGRIGSIYIFCKNKVITRKELLDCESLNAKPWDSRKLGRIYRSVNLIVSKPNLGIQ
ncbi:hypothetical protein CAEBREN_02027 [Caenorhabditis brenneri]|uniref:F-box domain-containing protein n=1 Tax=Caenorhabditis brenneri TaxID=135651 RepID=G0NDV6_CAEBE|nr:hypothetical protein CAEBREN_02027 [Caenorhabditis brenneri]